MMLALVLSAAALGAQAEGQLGDPVAVVVASQRPGAEDLAQEIAASLRVALARAAVPRLLDEATTLKRLAEAGSPNPARCGGLRSCVVKLATSLGTGATVASVDAAKLGDRLIVRLEAVAAADGSTLALAEFTAGTQSLYRSGAEPIAIFARALAAALGAPPEGEAPPSARPDVPRANALTPPAAAADQTAELVAPPPKPAPVGPAILTAGAAAAVATAVVFGALGLSDKAVVDGARYQLDGRSASRLPQSELDARAAQGNARLTVGLVSGLLGVALGAAAGVTWAVR